jgi:hypothetical protein
MPHELLESIEQGDSMAVLQLLSMIRDTCIPEDLSIWPVVDVSGSMSGVPMEVAIALALVVAYAQPDTTPSSRMFLTFDEEPRMYRLPPIFGEDAVELARVTSSLRNKPAGLNTNFSRSMDLMLDELVRRRDEGVMVAKFSPVIMVFTDMQFDQADDGRIYESNLDVMQRKYASAGIDMPLIIFWNLRGVSGNLAAAQPMRKNVVMLSGFSVDLFHDFLSMLKSGKFHDVQIPVNEPRETTSPNINTESLVNSALQSDMYMRYRLPLF